MSYSNTLACLHSSQLDKDKCEPCCRRRKKGDWTFCGSYFMAVHIWLFVAFFSSLRTVLYFWHSFIFLLPFRILQWVLGIALSSWASFFIYTTLYLHAAQLDEVKCDICCRRNRRCQFFALQNACRVDMRVVREWLSASQRSDTLHPRTLCSKSHRHQLVSIWLPEIQNHSLAQSHSCRLATD